MLNRATYAFTLGCNQNNFNVFIENKIYVNNLLMNQSLSLYIIINKTSQMMNERFLVEIKLNC